MVTDVHFRQYSYCALRCLNIQMCKKTPIHRERYDWYVQPHSLTYLSTLHVVAALVLLYGRLAIGAGLGVREQPQTVGCILVRFAHTSHFNNRGGEGW